MPNYCYYEMMIKGTKEHCYEWLKRMKDHNEPNHFFRMFNPINVEEAGDDASYCMTLSGKCAWSLDTCCRAYGYSEGKDLFSINTKELNIVMEAYSDEPGVGFQEHYIYNNLGECVCSECEDCSTWYYDPNEYGSFEEFRKEWNLPPSITEDMFENGEYKEGGFEDWRFCI